MDKLALRRALYTDPKQLSPHQLADDPALLQLRQELLTLDQQLQSTLNQPVPPQLAERILLAQRLATPHQRRRLLPLYAIAASAFFVSLWSWQWNRQPDADTGQQALAHVYHELAALSSGSQVTASVVSGLFAELGIETGASSVPVRYARFCDFGGVRSLHLVLDWQGEAVTLFVIPPGQGPTPAAAGQFADARFVGQTLAKAGHQLVLVAERADLLQKSSDRLGQALKFNI